MSRTVCRECHSPVDPEASRCPRCGYAPAEDDDHLAKYRKNRRLAGMVSLTIIGLPLGVLLLAQAYHHKRQADEATVAVEAAVGRSG